jgi:aldehyde dehydrogenase
MSAQARPVFDFPLRTRLFIDGCWCLPETRQRLPVVNPSTEETIVEVEAGGPADVDCAVRAASRAFRAWKQTSGAERAGFLRAIARGVEAHGEQLAALQSLNNGKPIAESRIDVGDVAATFDYYAGLAETLDAAEEEIAIPSSDHRAVIRREPAGVVGLIVPWNFPMVTTAWKLAPALAAGNCVVIKPAEQTPASLLFLFDIIGDLLPAGVVNIVNGFGIEAGAPLAQHKRIRKVAFTGETTTGRLIMQYASQNLIPVTLELGGKSANVFFEDVAQSTDDAYYDKALEGFTFFALNQGEVCTCPSRALIQRSIYDRFLGDGLERVGRIKQGNPLDPETMIGAQASNDQLEKILSYIEIGKAGGAKLLAGGERVDLGGDLSGGYYVAPTVFEGTNDMRIFQEEIFGPVVSVTSFDDFDDAIKIANDTLYGLGAGVWSRSGDTAYRAGRSIEAGRVWTNTYHQYPAHAAFGGYKQSGIGRELGDYGYNEYRQIKHVWQNTATDRYGYLHFAALSGNI